MVKEYYCAETVEAALERKLQAGWAEAWYLAGGSFMFAAASPSRPGSRTAADFPERVIDVAKALPKGLRRSGDELLIGAGTSLQELLESPLCFGALKAAARSMANRNIRNRATVGGNLAANKSCASLIPLCLALEANVEYRQPGSASQKQPLADWLAKPAGLLLELRLPLAAFSHAAFGRSSRTACDVSTVTVSAAAAFTGSGGPLASGQTAGQPGVLSKLRLALGGLGPSAVRRPDLEKLFEGKTVPAKAEIEAAVLPLLSAIDDVRGSAALKRQQAAVLVADCLHALEVLQ